MADHIRLRQAEGTWVVRAGGAVLGETERAIELNEGSHPPVIYFPREDVATAVLEPSDTTSVCPYRGRATYYSIQTKSTLIKDAAWSYETPNPGMERIAGHLAFSPEKATVEELL